MVDECRLAAIECISPLIDGGEKYRTTCARASITRNRPGLELLTGYRLYSIKRDRLMRKSAVDDESISSAIY